MDKNETTASTKSPFTVSGYESLAAVLVRAYDQAASGKGAERHASGEPFDKQVMQDGARRFGVSGLLFQAFKKSEESQRLPHDAAVRELLGAINYLAGAVIAMEGRREYARESVKQNPDGTVTIIGDVTIAGHANDNQRPICTVPGGLCPHRVRCGGG